MSLLQGQIGVKMSVQNHAVPASVKLIRKLTNGKNFVVELARHNNIFMFHVIMF